MYFDFFGLNMEPFGLSPNIDLLYPSRSHEETMAHLAYGLEHGEEIILITGMIGIGKTLAIQSLAERIAKTFRCVIVNTTLIGFREFLKLVLYDLEVPIDPRADVADLINAFKQLIVSGSMKGRRLLLVVDEAQNLSVEVLESLRLLLNLVPGGDCNPVIVLVGQPGLEANIKQPEMLQLQQRIRVHYRMEPMSRGETDEFIRHRLALCGQEREIFSADAITLIHRHSGGVPRLVNHLADKALLSAYVDGKHKVAVTHVDLTDLPPIDNSGTRERAELQPEPARSSEPIVVPPRVKEPPRNDMARRRQRPRWIGPVFIGATLVVATVVLVWLFGPKISEFLSTRSDSGATTVRHDVGDMNYKPSAVVDSVAGEAAPAPIASLSDSAAGLVDPVHAKVDHADTAATLKPDDASVAESTAIVEVKDSGADDSREYVIHVASFRSKARANILIADLAEKGYAAECREHIVNGILWERVLVGPVSGHAEVEALEKKMRDAGLITFSRIMPR